MIRCYGFCTFPEASFLDVTFPQPASLSACKILPVNTVASNFPRQVGLLHAVRYSVRLRDAEHPLCRGWLRGRLCLCSSCLHCCEHRLPRSATQEKPGGLQGEGCGTKHRCRQEMPAVLRVHPPCFNMVPAGKPRVRRVACDILLTLFAAPQRLRGQKRAEEESLYGSSDVFLCKDSADYDPTKEMWAWCDFYSVGVTMPSEAGLHLPAFWQAFSRSLHVSWAAQSPRKALATPSRAAMVQRAGATARTKPRAWPWVDSGTRTLARWSWTCGGRQVLD